MEGVQVRELRIQGPQATGQGYRIIVKAVDETLSPFVGFAGGDGLTEALVALDNKIQTDGLKLNPEVSYADWKKAQKDKDK